MSGTAPTSFMQIEGWRESFEAARVRLDETRTDALFPEIPTQLCGEWVRAFTLKDWTILADAGNPFVVGGPCEIKHASNILFQLRTGCLRWVKHGRVADALRGQTLKRVLTRYGFDELAVVADVGTFIDDAFLDMPGRFGKAAPASVTDLPRYADEVALCGEVMAQFPSFHHEDLRNMPLAQFWQWLHRARKKADPEYRNDQLTDHVNRQALGELNRIRKAAKKTTETNAA